MHRPERWGYLQFSTAEPGSVGYRVDPAAASRDRLMQIYYAQTALFKQNKKWATSLTELEAPSHAGIARAHDEPAPHTGRL